VNLMSMYWAFFAVAQFEAARPCIFSGGRPRSSLAGGPRHYFADTLSDRLRASSCGSKARPPHNLFMATWPVGGQAPTVTPLMAV
jgi:hypothetical protein